MSKFLSFREAYNGCFVNGVALAESATIHIKRSVTTLTEYADEYRHARITLEFPNISDERSDALSVILHKFYPSGFFSDNLFIGVVVDDDDVEYCAMIMHDLSIQGLVRKFEIAYLPSSHFEEFFKAIGTLRFNPPIRCEKVKAIGSNGPIIDTVKFEKSRSYEAKVEFYPFLTEVFDKPLSELTIDFIVNDFMTSKSNLLLLIGPPGTGKTTLTRSFITESCAVRLVENAAVLASSELSLTFRSSVADNKQMLTIYEDADVFVEARNRGNVQLSALLNQLDGVLASNEKFIISTNLESLSKVDAALLRPGRCHHIFNFRPLDAAEANLAREAVGLDRVGFVVEEGKECSVSLTEALHYKRHSTNISRTPKSIGF